MYVMHFTFCCIVKNSFLNAPVTQHHQVLSRVLQSTVDWSVCLFIIYKPVVWGHREHIGNFHPHLILYLL